MNDTQFTILIVCLVAGFMLVAFAFYTSIQTTTVEYIQPQITTTYKPSGTPLVKTLDQIESQISLDIGP